MDNPNKNLNQLENNIICPISHIPLKECRELWIASDGYTYSSKNILIEALFNRIGLSPVHGGILSDILLVRNYSVMSYLKHAENAGICSITRDLYQDPVVLMDDGHTYEKQAIVQWLENHDKSPNTGSIVSHRILVPNIVLCQLMGLDIKTKENIKVTKNPLKVYKQGIIPQKKDLIYDKLFRKLLDGFKLDKENHFCHHYHDLMLLRYNELTRNTNFISFSEPFWVKHHFTGLDLSGLVIENFNPKGSEFVGCNISDTKWINCHLGRTRWDNAIVENVMFENCNFTGENVDFNTTFKNVKFNNCIIEMGSTWTPINSDKSPYIFIIELKNRGVKFDDWIV